jgi:DNA-directed RNA polymerase subunit RPC12/RpoP
MDTYYEAMRQKGFSRNTVDSVRKIKCPQCGFEFALVYGRTTACRGCPEAIRSCPKARCPKCDLEFFIKEAPNIANPYRQRQVADHMSGVWTDYLGEQGWKKSR